jgi:hypothetical protein
MHYERQESYHLIAITAKETLWIHQCQESAIILQYFFFGVDFGTVKNGHCGMLVVFLPP